jgi:hypothetical protein
LSWLVPAIHAAPRRLNDEADIAPQAAKRSSRQNQTKESEIYPRDFSGFVGIQRVQSV